MLRLVRSAQSSVGHQDPGQDQDPAHGRRARLGLVCLRPLLADVLADLEGAQPLDHPGPEDQDQEERRQARHRGPERDVADHVQARDLVAERGRAGGRASALRHRLSPKRCHERVDARVSMRTPARALDEHRRRPRAPASGGRRGRRGRVGEVVEAPSAQPRPRAPPPGGSGPVGPTPTTTSTLAGEPLARLAGAAPGPWARARACRRGTRRAAARRPGRGPRPPPPRPSGFEL